MGGSEANRNTAFLTKAGRDLRVIYAAVLLRSIGIGLTGVVLGVYLARAGFPASRIGLVIAAGLAGCAAGTAVVGFRADRLGRRLTLVGMAILAVVGGAGFALTKSFSALLTLAFLGMLNAMGNDRGPVFALEQAIIPQLVPDERRTWALSWYGLVLDAGHAVGALAAMLPILFQHWLGVDLVTSYRITFGFYASLNAISVVFYSRLSARVEAAQNPSLGVEKAEVSPASRSAVLKLSGLSAIDSLGGGFVTDALIAYWFFLRFGVSETGLGVLFFVAHLLNSGSYLVAAWLSRRIGLVNTMVFTHIPSSLFLVAVPLAPSVGWAVALLLGREALVEMDVPTRQSYILAVVQPNERTYASGVTNLTRNISRAVTPSVAGYLMQHLTLAMPLFLGGGIKIFYDLLLYVAFRRLKPPEEREPLTTP